MINQEIKDWVQDQDRDPEKGIDLYIQYGSSKNLKRRLERKRKSAWAKARAFQLLKAKVNAAQAPTPPNYLPPKRKTPQNRVPSKMETSKPLDTPVHIDRNYPQDLDQEIIQMRKLYNQRAKLSNSLHTFSLTEISQRKLVVDEILELTEAIQTIKGQLNYFDKHNEIQPVPEQGTMTLPDSKAELLRLRGNKRSQVSKAKKRLGKLLVDHPKRSAAEQKLEMLQLELKEIEEKLKSAK